MKYLKVSFVIVLIILSTNLYSQTIRLTDPKSYKGLHVFLMPGKSPEGEKLFQFSVTKFRKLNDNIRVDSLILNTLSGKHLTLSKPKKLVNGREMGVGKEWFSSFSLDPNEISFISNETISDILLLVNNKEIKITFPDSARIELHDVVSAHF